MVSNCVLPGACGISIGAILGQEGQGELAGLVDGQWQHAGMERISHASNAGSNPSSSIV